MTAVASAPTTQTLFEQQQAYALPWRQSSLRDRKTQLHRFREAILAQRETIRQAVMADLGKPAAEADLSEVYPVVSEINHVISHLDEWARPLKVDAPLTMLGTRAEVRYEAKGVCLIIGPWNYPFMLTMGPLVSCLAAGNTAILKPSEYTPRTSAVIAELVRSCFPRELVTVVEGGIEESTALLRLPFDHIFFTGSPAVGKVVMRAAAENLASVTLELGGKSPTIIDETARLDDAVKRISYGKWLNNGQSCIAPDYVWVHEKVKDDFVEKLQRAVTNQFGQRHAITAQSPDYARVINDKNFQRLDQLLEDAVGHGAKVEWSGPREARQRFFHPVILSGVSLEARIMQEEIFGPILPILTYTDEEEVIRHINAQPKALALYVFTTRKSFFEKVMAQTSSGTACLNDCVLQFVHPNLPFGGVNNSGIGKAHGEAGFRAFSNEKSIVKQKNGFASPYALYPPYNQRVRKVLDMLIKWF